MLEHRIWNLYIHTVARGSSNPPLHCTGMMTHQMVMTREQRMHIAYSSWEYYARLTSNHIAGAYAPATYSSSSRALLSASVASAPLFGARQILSSVPFFNRLVTPSVMPSVTPNCTLLGQQAEPACVQQSNCSHCFQSKLEDIGLDANIHMVSRTINPYRLQSLASCSLKDSP